MMARDRPGTITRGTPEEKDSGHRHHGWTMACEVSLLVIAVVLVATSVTGPGVPHSGDGCAAMMAGMGRSSNRT